MPSSFHIALLALPLAVLLALLETSFVRSFAPSTSLGRRCVYHPYRCSTVLHDIRDVNRREFFQSAFSFGLALSGSSASLLFPEVSSAAEQSSAASKSLRKPFAPNEALLPAARVKLSIDQAVILATKLIDDPNPSNSVALLDLENLILKPQNYVGSLKLQGVPEAPAKKYLESYRPMSGDLPFQLYLTKRGDVDTWKDLKRKEKEQERTSEIRAALNAYTDALSFSGDTYLLNVDKATQSNMVRGDLLPDVKQVITSDMGMRYLYRNQILTSMDDVQAELVYQMKLAVSRKDEVDGKELLNLLEGAQRGCDRWFGLIDPNDVREAFETVAAEQ
jgi:hypothetical protein